MSKCVERMSEGVLNVVVKFTSHWLVNFNDIGMKPIKDLLKNTYEKRLRTYDEIEQINTELKKHTHTLSPSGQRLLDSRTNISYKNNTLIIFIPVKLFSPETHFAANELKELFQRSKNKSIRVVRFAPEKN